jgi:hypothetical protein
MAPEAWTQEAPLPAAAPPRFQSEEEEQEESRASFVELEAPAPLETPAPVAPVETAYRFEPEEQIAAPSRPQFAELAEEPVFTPLPRGFVGDTAPAGRGLPGNDDLRGQQQPASFGEGTEEAQPDLDTPAFMRRLRF